MKKKHWFLKAELLVLLCLVVLWIVDLRTDCVPRAAAGALRQVVRAAPNCRCAHELLYDTYVMLGRYDDADEAYFRSEMIACKRAVQLDPPAINEEEFIKKQEAQQIRNLNMEMKNVDEYVSEQQQNIENWYVKNLAILQQWAKEWHGQLEEEEKVAWARFCQNMENIVSSRSGHLRMNSHGYANTYIMPDGYAMTNGHFTTDGRFSETTNTSVVGDPAGQYDWERTQIKNSREFIKRKFSELEQKRKNYLAEVERYAERVRARICADKRHLQKRTQVKLRGGPGVVEAISIGGNSESFIMIDGKFAYEGSMVNGFKVHKIYPDRVEFEKDGKIWVQKMR